MGLSASQRYLMGLSFRNTQGNVQANKSDKTKLASDQARLSDEYNKAIGGNNPTVENKEIPADDILGIMDAMSKNVNTAYNTFK